MASGTSPPRGVLLSLPHYAAYRLLFSKSLLRKLKKTFSSFHLVVSDSFPPSLDLPHPHSSAHRNREKALLQRNALAARTLPLWGLRHYFFHPEEPPSSPLMRFALALFQASKPVRKLSRLLEPELYRAPHLQKLLALTPPSLVLLSEPGQITDICLYRYARQKKCPVYCLISHFETASHLTYSPFTPQKTLVTSKAIAEDLVQRQDLPSTQIALIKNAYYQDLTSLAQKKSAPSPRSLGLALSNPTDGGHQKNLTLLKTLLPWLLPAKEEKNAALLIRPHPFYLLPEAVPLLREIEECTPPSAHLFLPTSFAIQPNYTLLEQEKENVVTFLQSIEHLIAGPTAFLLDALSIHSQCIAFGTPADFRAMRRSSLPRKLFDNGSLLLAQNKGELSALCKKRKPSPPSRPQTLQLLGM